MVKLLNGLFYYFLWSSSFTGLRSYHNFAFLSLDWLVIDIFWIFSVNFWWIFFLNIHIVLICVFYKFFPTLLQWLLWIFLKYGFFFDVYLWLKYFLLLFFSLHLFGFSSLNNSSLTFFILWLILLFYHSSFSPSTDIWSDSFWFITELLMGRIYYYSLGFYALWLLVILRWVS